MVDIKHEALALTVKETAETLKLSTNSVYDAIRRGDIHAIRIGGKFVVPVDGLRRILEGQAA